MARRETDLDRITTLLGQCLGRIDEQTYRLQKLEDDEEDFDAVDVLEKEAATLQEIIGALIHARDVPEQADLNRIVDRAVQACLSELGFPVVVHQDLERDLPPIAGGPGQIAYAVQRALMLGTRHAGPGGEVRIATRREADHVVFELETQGRERDRHLRERAATLREFVAGFDGRCHVEADERGTLLIALELPAELALDES